MMVMVMARDLGEDAHGRAYQALLVCGQGRSTVRSSTAASLKQRGHNTDTELYSTVPAWLSQSLTELL